MRGEGLREAWLWVRRWLTTTNHKDIGLLYIVTSIYFFLVAGVLGMLVRAQLTDPSNRILVGDAYNQAVTIHGLIMLLWFVSPLAFGLANYIVPLQIGARDLAFPRLNALSYWLYLASGLIILSGFFTPGGAVDVGWTMYAPLTTSIYSPGRGVDLAAIAILLFSASVTLGTINFLTTIVKMRAPGLTWSRMPMFPWSILFTVLLMLWAFPTLIAATLLLASDRMLGTSFYLSYEGGALLWDHLFWFFGHPEVYILLFPALGMVADIVSTFSRRQLYAKNFIILGLSIAIALSYVVWIHHMFITGIGLSTRKLFSFTTAIISVPFEMAVLALILTLWRGKVWYTTPMLFALGSIFNFIIGGATGVYLASVPLDIQFRGTYWVVAHFHYIVVGVITLGMVAGLYYWFPKITGRMYDERLGKLHFALAMIGLQILYLPMFALFSMPRRYYTYPEEWALLNQVASFGALVFGASFLVGGYALLKGLLRGPPAGPNPWMGYTMEWLLPSPPPRHNFEGDPMVTQEGRITFVAANGGLGGHAHVEHSTMTPFLIGAGTLLAGLGIGFHPGLLAAGAALALAAVLKWLYDDVKDRFVIPEPEMKEDWPFTGVDKVRTGVWTFIAGDAFIFGSLIGAYIFIRSRSLSWQPGFELHDVTIGLVNTFILFTATFFYLLAYASVRRGNQLGLLLGLAVTIALAFSFILVKAVEWSILFMEGFTLSSGLQAQLYYVLTGLHGVHVLLGALATMYLLAKALAGKYTAGSHQGLLQVGIYWGLVELVWLFLFPMFYLI